MSTLVSGGRVASAMTSQLSKPTIDTRVGHDDAALAQRVGDAAGDLVVAAEDRVGRRAPAAEELRDRLAAPALRPDAGQIEALRLGEPGRGERLAVAVAAEPHGLEPLRPGDVGDPPAAEPDEMLGGERRAAFVVGQEAEASGSSAWEKT